MSLQHRSARALLILAGLLAALIASVTWQPLHAGAPVRHRASEERAFLPARSHHGAEPGTTRLRLGLIEGRVLLQGRTRHSGVRIMVNGQHVATSDETGRFVVRDVVPGTYVITAQMPGYLGATRGYIAVPAGKSISLAASPVTLLAGDVNGDNRVNVFDVAIVVSEARGTDVPRRSDLNDDGIVNLLDLVLVSGNYGEVAPLSWGAVRAPADSLRSAADLKPAGLSPVGSRQGQAGGTIEGWVVLQGRARHGGASVLLDDDPVATTDDDGHFVVENVPAGFRTLVLEAPGFLSSGPIHVTISTGQTVVLTRGSLTLLAGDVDGDKMIGPADLALIVAAFGGTTPEALRADLNGDGVVDMSDLVLAASNADATPAPAPTLMPGTPQPTATPAPATETSIPPTPTRTATPTVPPATATPSPTATPAATATPGPATPTGLPRLSAGQPECVVQAVALHLRQGPGTAYPVLIALPNGTVVHPEKRDAAGGWILVSVPDPYRGWLAASYLTCNVALQDLAVETQLPPLETTPVPVGPFPTPTPYPAPILMNPPDGHNFIGEVTLTWMWSGQLGRDEHFDVQVWRLGEKPRGAAWSDTWTWTGGLYKGDGPYQWRIVVIRGRDGHWQADLSRPSQIRWFNYYSTEPPKEKKTPIPAAPRTPTAPMATPALPTPTMTNTTGPALPTATHTITAYPPPPSPTATAYPAPLRASPTTSGAAELAPEPGPVAQPVPTPHTSS